MPRGIADIHLVCGATGAGKTTYSRDLARDIGGVVFSIDEWMEKLHNVDKPAQNLYAWFYERVQRNCAQMRRVSEQLVPLNIPVVFDCGLTNKTERDIFVNWAEDMGFSLKLHFRDVPPETRWQRVQRRNVEQAETYTFQVTREMFDFVESLWEAPNEFEMAKLNGIRIPD